MADQLDPVLKVELAMVRAEHQKKYQVMIAYIKAKVGEGIEYRNDVVRIVASNSGAYYELNDLPEEFSGATGEEIDRRFVQPSEAIALLTRAVEVSRAASLEEIRQCSILVLYSRSGLVDRKNCYVFDYRRPDDEVAAKPVVIGAFKPDVMPLFFKIRLDADFARDVLDMTRGIVFCMANAGDRNLLVRIPLGGGDIVDLAGQASSSTVN